MGKIKDTFWPQKKRKLQYKYIGFAAGVLAQKLINGYTIKSSSAFIKKTERKKRFGFSRFLNGFIARKRKLYFKKMMQIEIDLGFKEMPFIITKKFSIDQFHHFLQSVRFFPRILRFLFLYPSSSTVVGKMFSFGKIGVLQSKKLWDFIKFSQDIINKRYVDDFLEKNKIKNKMKLTAKILKKNILNYKVKTRQGEEKYRTLFGITYKLRKIQKRKWKRNIKQKTQQVKYIINRLTKTKLKKSNKPKNKYFIKLFTILNKLEENKKEVTKKNVEKSLANKSNTSIIDFFYIKHIKEMEDYCFK